MAVFQPKKPRMWLLICLQGWMSQLVLSLCWIPKEIGSDPSEGRPQQQDSWACQQWLGQADREQKASFFHVLHVGSHQKVWPRFRADRPTLNDPDLGCSGSFYLQWSDLENPSQVWATVWVSVDSRCGPADNQEKPSKVEMPYIPESKHQFNLSSATSWRTNLKLVTWF